MTANQRGSAFMVLSMLGFAAEDALFKFAIETLPRGPALVLFGLIATAICAALSRAAGEPVWAREFTSQRLLLRSSVELAGRLFYALALAFVPLATTTAILQSAPLVVALGAAVLFGERVGPRRWLAMIVGFLGVMMILRPTPAGFEPTVIFALLGTLGFAGRDLATRASPPHVSVRQLGTLGFMVVTAAGVVLSLVSPAPVVVAPMALAAIAATAIFGVIGYNALSVAMRTGEVSVVAPFRYSRLIAALAVAVLVFGERPDALTILGAGLIVVSGLYTLFRSGRA